MLQQDYDGKIAALTTSLATASSEIEVYKQRKAEYEENMKKAFMRGVCALNMEAMTMWKAGGEDGIAGLPSTTFSAAKMSTSTAAVTSANSTNSVGLHRSSGKGNGSENSGRTNRRSAAMVERHDFTVVP